MLLLLFLSLLVSNVLAGIYVINPLQGSTCRAGQPCTVDWMEDGQSPLLSAIGLTSVGLYTGNQQLVQAITPVDVSRVHSLTFTPIREAGPNSGTYYVSFVAVNLLRNNSLPYSAFSPFFRLDGMTGSFSNPLSSAISSISVSTTATLPPITGDPLTTITVGTLSTTSRSTSSSVSSASVTSSTPTVVSTTLTTTVSSQSSLTSTPTTPTPTSTSTLISVTSLVIASANAIPSGFTTSVVSNTDLLPSTTLTLPNSAVLSPSVTSSTTSTTSADPQANTNDAVSTVMGLNSRSVNMMGLSFIVMLLVL